MTLLVLPHARVLGWAPGRGFRLADRGQLVPAADALTRAWGSDAHAVGYVATRAGKPWPWRLTAAATGRVAIWMRWAIFDVDAPWHAAPSPEWRTAERANV